MAINLTDSQKNAVNSDGTVLVAAAAGSGKTAVIVERVMRLLSDPKRNISADNLLIVTFTNAAAAELRYRIEKRINAECIEHPENKFLRVQKIKIRNAKICTIDSFCIELVRNNFQKLGVSPNIKIVTEESVASIKDTVVSNLVEKYFFQHKNTFSELVHSLDGGMGISSFKDSVYSLYKKSRSLPSPQNWLNGAKDLYNDEFKNSVFYKNLFLFSLKEIDALITKIDQALVDMNEDLETKLKCEDIFISASESLKKIKEALLNENWNDTVLALNSFEFIAFGNLVRASNNSELKQVLGTYREYILNSIKELKKYFDSDFDTAKEINIKTGKLVSLLVDFTDEFGKLFEQELVINDSMTFSMAEHFALKLLCDFSKHPLEISPLAKDLSNIYKEVLVDEFQDVNDLQDSLFYALSDCGKNLFTVGDVKQSIYGFRYANPDNFLDKKDKYSNYDGKTYPAKIILDANFRSRKEICNFINFLFKKIMSKEAAEIEYNFEEILSPNAKFCENNSAKNEVYLLENSSVEKDDVFEIMCTAEYIKNTVGKKILQDENGNLREVTYDDFAILLRSANTVGEKYAKIFSRYGIPVSFSVNTFENSSEVLSVISVLKTIDNPRNSIALLSTLNGPVFNISMNDIASIRAKFKNKTLFGSVTAAANCGNRIFSDFLKEFKVLKRLSVTMSVADFIMYLYKKYSVSEIFGALPGGESRQSNLLNLVKVANSFNSDNIGGLSSFLRFFDKMSESGGFKQISNNSTDPKGVKIMTIHSSKGLQFPICIVGMCAKHFSNEDTKNQLSACEKFGIGLKLKNAKMKIKVSSLSRKMVDLEIKRKTFREEMRLLYVAATRAEEKLVFFSTYGNLSKKVSDIACNIGPKLFNGFIPSDSVLSCKSYADWLISALLFHPKCSEIFYNEFGINRVCDYGDFSSVPIELIIKKSVIEPETQGSTERKNLEVDLENVKKIAENLSWNYKYSAVLDNRAKISVTELLKEESDKDYNFSARPECLYSGGLTPTEKGELAHKVLELIDYSKAKENLEDEILRLTEWEYISKDEVKNLNIKSIKEFLNSDLCNRILQSCFVRREQKFITKIFDSQNQYEGLIVQGCADLIFEEGDNLIIVDFKTTIFNTDDEFVSTYKKQLDLYADALSEIYEKPVKEKIIYSLYLNRQINV